MSRRSAGDRLAERLEALERALEVGAGRLDAKAVAEARGVLERAGERRRLSPEHTVVALAGATGSGKSSLFNALAGLDLAPVGVRRPTTDAPMACVWGPEGAGPLLEWLGIPQRHQVNRESVLDADRQSALRGLVLLDLPDHDSTELAHRLEVDRLVERVDLMVWVVDPQKYADQALHERYLRRLAGHRAVTVVVLNQIDTLPPAAAVACLEDLQRLLTEDGLGGATVLTTAAPTGDGVPALREVVAQAVSRREALTARLAADVDRVVERLTAGVGAGEVKGVGRRERRELLDALSEAAGVPAVVRATAASYRYRAVAATGWPFTRWVRRLRPDPLRRLHLDAVGGGGRSSIPEAPPVARAQVATAVRRVSEASASGLPRQWSASVARVARPSDADLADALDRAVVATPLGADRRPLWWRLLWALQWLLALAALAGLVWLVALFVVAWLRLPDPPTYDVGPVALPTLLLLGGVVLGLVVALAGRIASGVGARRRARRAEAKLRDAIERVAQEQVVQPVVAELGAHREVRELLARARRG
jgi:GTP-binding protein EngB required for normal cell division